MSNTDLNLSLDGKTFSDLKEQYDDILRRTVGNMEMRGSVDAVITMKHIIHLEHTKRSTPDGVVDVIIPSFKHDITSVIQTKDKVSGQLRGEYQLVFDKDEEEYIMRKIDSGQQSMFEDDEPVGKFVDKDYEPGDEYVEAGDASGGSAEVSELPDGTRGLPAPESAREYSPQESETEDETEGESETEDAEANSSGETEDDAAGRSQSSVHESVDDTESAEPEPTQNMRSLHPERYDESTPFGWLAQFVGKEMRITEAMGNYTVRTVEGNKVVLSSATSPSSPFYCEKEKLRPHTQHKLFCAGYGEDLVVISIQCSDCGDALFTLIAPGATEQEVSDAMSMDDDETSEQGSYGYEPPEE